MPRTLHLLFFSRYMWMKWSNALLVMNRCECDHTSGYGREDMGAISNECVCPRQCPHCRWPPPSWRWRTSFFLSPLSLLLFTLLSCPLRRHRTAAAASENSLLFLIESHALPPSQLGLLQAGMHLPLHYRQLFPLDESANGSVNAAGMILFKMTCRWLPKCFGKW